MSSQQHIFRKDQHHIGYAIKPLSKGVNPWDTASRSTQPSVSAAGRAGCLLSRALHSFWSQTSPQTSMFMAWCTNTVPLYLNSCACATVHVLWPSSPCPVFFSRLPVNTFITTAKAGNFLPTGSLHIAATELLFTKNYPSSSPSFPLFILHQPVTATHKKSLPCV